MAPPCAPRPGSVRTPNVRRCASFGAATRCCCCCCWRTWRPRAPPLDCRPDWVDPAVAAVPYCDACYCRTPPPRPLSGAPGTTIQCGWTMTCAPEPQSGARPTPFSWFCRWFRCFVAAFFLTFCSCRNSWSCARIVAAKEADACTAALRFCFLGSCCCCLQQFLAAAFFRDSSFSVSFLAPPPPPSPAPGVARPPLGASSSLLLSSKRRGGKPHWR